MAMYMSQKVPIVFGEGAAAQVGERLLQYGCRKPLIIYDEGVEKAGLVSRITDSVKAAGIAPRMFMIPDNEPNDTLIDKYAEELRGVDIDSCVALGGGSVIDGSKCILAVMKNPGKSIRDFMYHIPGNDPVVKNTVPVIVIPTTSGTGCDVSEYAMIVDSRTEFKSWIEYPSALSLLDPLMTISLPRSLTAETGMDAFAHAAETATAIDATIKSDILDLYAIRLIARWLPVAVKDGSDIEARAQMHIAASLAGMSYNDVALHLGHAIAHNLGTVFGISHGMACALAMPETMRFVARAVPDKVRRIGEAMGIEFAPGATAESIGDMTADRLYAFLAEIGIPKISAMGFTREQIVGMAAHTVEVERSSGSLDNTPGGPVTKEMLENILGRMYDNY